MQAVIDRAETDPQFRSRLRADPAVVFGESGVETRDGVRFEVVEVTRGDIFLPLGARTGIADLDRILERAERDTSFKDELLSKDPKSAIEAHVGKKLPPSCKVHVRTTNSDTIYICVPDSPESTRELSEEDLDTVSGGVAGEYALFFLSVLVAAAVPLLTTTKRT
jgi:hypothetical protein